MLSERQAGIITRKWLLRQKARRMLHYDTFQQDARSLPADHIEMFANALEQIENLQAKLRSYRDTEGEEG